MPIKKAHHCRKLIVSALTAQTLLKESTEEILGGNLSRSVGNPSLGWVKPEQFQGNVEEVIQVLIKSVRIIIIIIYSLNKAPFNIKMIKRFHSMGAAA